MRRFPLPLVLPLLLACGDDKPGTDTGTTTPAGDTGCGCDTPVTFYADMDADGYGDPDASVEACEAPTGYVGNAADCDDGDWTVHPEADELCNGVDDDCDGEVDESPADGATWYADADGDGYGDPGAPVTACDQPSGAVADGSDCDDGDATVYPGAPELCDGVQNDCDAAWTGDDGTATWFGDDGTITDLGPTFGTGIDGAPASWSSTDDGLLRVCGGTWYVSLALTGDTVEVEGIDAPVLDGGMAARPLRVAPTTAASVHDLTLQRGSNGGDGGCLYASGTGTLAVENVEIASCVAGADGGGAYLEGLSYASFTKVTFSANEAGDNGGGLAASGVGALAADTVTLVDDTAGVGGGGAYLYQTPSSWTTLVVSGDVGATGGGLHVAGGSLVVDGASFTDNTASSAGGAIYCSNAVGSSVTVTDGVMTGNTSANQGGALYANSNTTSGTACESVTLTDVEISDNMATNYGGGVSDFATTSTYERVSILDNWSPRGIGAAYLRGETKLFTECVISGNWSNEWAQVYQDQDGIEVTAIDTEISNGSGGNGYGSVTVQRGTFTCQGSTSSDTWGIWGNTAGYADGVVVSEEGTFIAVDCDMGDGTVTPDNDGTDVYMQHGAATYDYGNDATFTCDGATGICN